MTRRRPGSSMGGEPPSAAGGSWREALEHDFQRASSAILAQIEPAMKAMGTSSQSNTPAGSQARRTQQIKPTDVAQNKRKARVLTNVRKSALPDTATGPQVSPGGRRFQQVTPHANGGARGSQPGSRGQGPQVQHGGPNRIHNHGGSGAHNPGGPHRGPANQSQVGPQMGPGPRGPAVNHGNHGNRDLQPWQQGQIGQNNQFAQNNQFGQQIAQQGQGAQGGSSQQPREHSLATACIAAALGAGGGALALPEHTGPLAFISVVALGAGVLLLLLRKS